MRPPQRSSTDEIADAIASAVAAQVPAAVPPPPLVPELAPALPFAAPPPPSAPSAPVSLAAPADVEESAGAPGWVVLYVFVCVVLTALGAAVLGWWRTHGLW
jgi:hypothetical protein